MRKQIDYYFSVANLVKDVFLRSKMNDSGWIPLMVCTTLSTSQAPKLLNLLPFSSSHSKHSHLTSA